MKISESVWVVVPGSEEPRRGVVVGIFSDGAYAVRVEDDIWTLQRWEVDGTDPPIARAPVFPWE